MLKSEFISGNSDPGAPAFSNMSSATTAKAVLVISMTPEQLDEEVGHACGMTCPLPYWDRTSKMSGKGTS